MKRLIQWFLARPYPKCKRCKNRHADGWCGRALRVAQEGT